MMKNILSPNMNHSMSVLLNAVPNPSFYIVLISHRVVRNVLFRNSSSEPSFVNRRKRQWTYLKKKHMDLKSNFLKIMWIRFKVKWEERNPAKQISTIALTSYHCSCATQSNTCYVARGTTRDMARDSTCYSLIHPLHTPPTLPSIYRLGLGFWKTKTTKHGNIW